MAASTTEMLMNSDGLVVNAYHNAEGRGNYFPGSAGTSEGQFLFIIGNLHVYQATGNPIAKEMAEDALKSLLKVVYRNMPVPDQVTQLSIFAPQWLFNVKYPFDSSIIHYDRATNFVDGVGYLTVDAPKVRYVYGARTMDSILLWDNPYSPLTQGTAYAVAGSEMVAGLGMKVTLSQPFTGQLYVTHSTQTGAPIRVDEPFEAWPDWRKLEPGEIACAADVFVWAHRAFTRASQVLSNPIWAAAARATREQAAIAFDINDSRDWIKPSWAKSPFAIGSRFPSTTRVPAPSYSVNDKGEVVIGVPTYGSGSYEVQYGNASVLDVYGANDVTWVEIGSSQPLAVTVFVDREQAYSQDNRYQAVLQLNGLGIQSIPLTRQDFVSPGTWGSTASVLHQGNVHSVVGNYRSPNDTTLGQIQIGSGHGYNSLGHTVMAQLYRWQGNYNAYASTLAVINGDYIDQALPPNGATEWLMQFNRVDMLRTDGSVLCTLPISEANRVAAINGVVMQNTNTPDGSVNRQIFDEYYGNPALVKFLRYRNTGNGATETVQLYARPLPAGMPVYTFGVFTSDMAAHTITLRRVRQTPPREVMYYPGAIPFTANFQGNPAQLIDWRGPIYMGYQSPAMWMTIGDIPAAETNIRMLADAQQQWRAQTGQTTLGPFAPVFIFDRPDAVQYGAPNTFTWEGPDPNTRWGGYQYRPLPELTDAAQHLPFGPIRDNAIAVAQNFIQWLAQDWAWLPSWAPWVDAFSHMIEHVAAAQVPVFSLPHVDEWTRLVNKTAAAKITAVDAKPPVLSAKNRYESPLFRVSANFPARPPLGPPTDFPKGPAEINYPEPHMAALILRSVIQMDQVLRPTGDLTGPMKVEHRAVISKCMAVLDALWIEDGVMAGTFSPAPGSHEWYGFWHGEILDTLASAYTWGLSPNVNRPSISRQARIWIDGMLRWSKSAVMPSEVGYQVVPWGYTPNWRNRVEETFEFSTQVFESFSGKEQRISRRTTPRRRLAMLHTLVGAEARGMEALLRAKQNLPLTVPQWHLAARVAKYAPAGQTHVEIEGAVPGAFVWNSVVMLSRGGGPATTATVMSTGGGTITFTAGLAEALQPGDKVLPAASALIDQSMSSTRHTGTVLESLANFLFLPQADPYALPRETAGVLFQVVSAGRADTREVIQFRPNWVKEPSVESAWSFNTSENFAAGPVVPISGRDQGNRTVQALWTLKNTQEIHDFKALIQRLQGRRYAAWLPSWTDDIELTRGVTQTDKLFVRPGPLVDLGTFLDPSIGVHLHLHTGQSLQARVVSVTEVSANEYQLLLDRHLPVTDLSAIQMASLLYRVRQASDTITIRYLTDSVAEVSAAFVSVYGEVENP